VTDIRKALRGRRLVIVSNRLPVTLEREEDGRLGVTASQGGLATAVGQAQAASDGLCVGWPGMAFEGAPERQEVSRLLAEEHHAVPVFLSQREVEQFYHGFSNQALWPILHYFPTHLVYDESDWQAYRDANVRFCEVVASVARPDDIIWVHDYHLMLLPALLRERMPEACIGFFLHVPFPSSEIFRILPCRREILEGMLGADHIAFHTWPYLQHFQKAVLRVLGVEGTSANIAHQGRNVCLEAFPIGIDPSRFERALTESRVTSKEVESLRAQFGSASLVVGVDRLDYSKGIPERIYAFERFLEKYPSWRQRVTFVQVASPSRDVVPSYRRLKRNLDEVVGDINGRYGTPSWTPIHYINQRLSLETLSALYHMADVALVTSLRDGMNLVAKEYVVCQGARPGALILSEFTGAATEMGEAYLINPWDTEGVADTLHEALSAPLEERRRRMEALHRRVKKYNVFWWTEACLGPLVKASDDAQRVAGTVLAASDFQRIAADFASARTRLLLLDYDGTLVPFAAKPEHAAATPDVLEALEALSCQARTTVVIVSGRDRVTLGRWLGGVGCELVAEHGGWFRAVASNSWKPMRDDLGEEWKEDVLPLLDHYVDRTPGAFVEDKEFSLAWHYRLADAEFGLSQAQELLVSLSDAVANTALQVVQGKKIVEVKWIELNKGGAVGRFLDPPPDFILAIGDDRTDEDMFRVLPPKALSVKVGRGESEAGARVSGPRQVLELLRGLIP